MKAVIMAGGKGARLRPLTEATPKPLVRLCGRPVLGYLFDWLEENGVGECILALGYRADQIREFCALRPGSLRISFSEEPFPLGTAGCVRKALEGSAPGPALVLSGDAVCGFSLRAVLRAHEKRGAFATLVTARAGDPREYGVVLSDDTGRVTGFVEKPAYPQAVSESVNTGIYVLSAQAVERLPDRGDFAGNFFPSVMKEQALYSWPAKGYWRDIGGVEAYLAASRDLLDSRPPASGPPVNGNYILRPPVWMGKNIRVGENAVVGPWAILDDGCSVGAGSEVSGTVLMPGARLGPRAVAHESVLCAGASARAGASLSGCVLGEKAVAGKGARLCAGVRVPGGVAVPEGALQEAGAPAIFENEGPRAALGVTPELAARMGRALGSMVRSGGGKCAVGLCAADRAGRILADAMSAGVRSVGASVMDFGNAFKALFYFGMRGNALPVGVMIDGGDKAALELFEAGGLPASRPLEREAAQRMEQGDFSPDGCGGLLDLSGIGAIYATELLRMAPDGLEGVRAAAVSENPAVERMLASALRRLGCVEDPSGIVLDVSPDGTRLSLRRNEIRLDPCRTVVAYGRILFRRGEDLAVENDFPWALNDYAERFGRRVYRYLQCPADGGDAMGRTLAARQYARDGLMLSLILLTDMRRRGVALADLHREIPFFPMREMDLALPVPPGRILSRLEGERAGEGVLLREKGRGTVLVRSRKSGGALHLRAEAANWEIADELCAETIEKLKRIARTPR